MSDVKHLHDLLLPNLKPEILLKQFCAKNRFKYFREIRSKSLKDNL